MTPGSGQTLEKTGLDRHPLDRRTGRPRPMEKRVNFGVRKVPAEHFKTLLTPSHPHEPVVDQGDFHDITGGSTDWDNVERLRILSPKPSSVKASLRGGLATSILLNLGTAGMLSADSLRPQLHLSLADESAAPLDLPRPQPMSVSATFESGAAELLPSDYWEDFWEGCRLPQTIRAAAIPDENQLFRQYLPSSGADTTLAEVGCAPGKWLHYFASEFGYSVTGIDYAPNACETTRRNLRILGIPGHVVNADIFQYSPQNGFDVVTSFGLIEHFNDLQRIVNRLVALVKPGGLIVSTVPNLYGPEGWVLRTVRPKVYAGHVRIGLAQFQQVHESAGAETLFANYLGGLFLTPPLRGTQFARRHPRLGLLANLPAISVNRVVRYVQVASGVFPRFKYVSPKLVYIGRRSERVP